MYLTACRRHHQIIWLNLSACIFVAVLYACPRPVFVVLCQKKKVTTTYVHCCWPGCVRGAMCVCVCVSGYLWRHYNYYELIRAASFTCFILASFGVMFLIFFFVLGNNGVTFSLNNFPVISKPKKKLWQKQTNWVLFLVKARPANGFWPDLFFYIFSNSRLHLINHHQKKKKGKKKFRCM